MLSKDEKVFSRLQTVRGVEFCRPEDISIFGACTFWFAKTDRSFDVVKSLLIECLSLPEIVFSNYLLDWEDILFVFIIVLKLLNRRSQIIAVNI